MATPLQTVKTQFGNKQALIDQLAPLLDRAPAESEAEFRERLVHVSNAKLLRLWRREQTVREKFGSREALADQIVALRAGEPGDADLRRKVLGLGTGRLLAMLDSARRRAN